MMVAGSNGAVQMHASDSRSGLDYHELRQLVHRNESMLGSLGGASILITGATGWFGVWLLDLLCTADDLLQLGVRVTAVSREPVRFLEKYRGFSGDPRITWIKADVRQLDASGDFSHIIHGATDTSMSSANDASLQLFESILDGTRRVIAAAGSRCKSVLLLSSGAVYGPARHGIVRFVETEPGGPDPASVNSTYAEGKRAAEHLGAIAATMGVPIRIARCFAFVGPHMPFDRHFAIGNFIADAVHGRPIRVRSDGLPQRSYLYMTDLMVALLLILTKGSIGRPYNVGSDLAVTIEQLAHCVDRVVGGQGVSTEGAASDPRDRYVPDTTRLRTELDFAPEVALETAIARTAAWYRARMDESMSS
jgi:dTDP-glucose 4,6-dehydratase